MKAKKAVILANKCKFTSEYAVEIVIYNPDIQPFPFDPPPELKVKGDLTIPKDDLYLVRGSIDAVFPCYRISKCYYQSYFCLDSHSDLRVGKSYSAVAKFYNYANYLVPVFIAMCL